MPGMQTGHGPKTGNGDGELQFRVQGVAMGAVFNEPDQERVFSQGNAAPDWA